MVFRYLASGNTFTDLHYVCRLGISTISGIVYEVCSMIWKILQKEYIPNPSKQVWIYIAEEFQKRAHFLPCTGAINGKYIRVNNFAGSGSMNFNCQRYFSIVLLVIVDADYHFIYIDIGEY